LGSLFPSNEEEVRTLDQFGRTVVRNVGSNNSRREASGKQVLSPRSIARANVAVAATNSTHVTTTALKKRDSPMTPPTRAMMASVSHANMLREQQINRGVSVTPNRVHATQGDMGLPVA
jgi:hypothetical protein